MRAQELHDRQRCPVTGTSITDALAAERALLQPVPLVHEPFDVVVARRASRDCLGSFEGRRYSVPFCWVGRMLEVRGTARDVVCFAEGTEVARHARGPRRRSCWSRRTMTGPRRARSARPRPWGVARDFIEPW